MSNTNIREAVNSAITGEIGRVPAGYERVVTAVVEAVEALAETVADNLREQGRALGATEAQVEAALTNSGLVEVAPVQDAPEDRLGKLEALVNRLVEAARVRGIRV